METYDSDLPKIEEFVDLRGKSLLEVGCGDGRLTALLADKPQKITAIDPDEASMEVARKNVAGIDFRVGSGEKLNFDDDSFDIVLFSYSLHHQDCEKALTEARKVVRPGGQILILEPTHDGEFTEFVSVFEPQEKKRLQRTCKYITSGKFQILRQDKYGVDYPFTNEEELYDYFIMKFSTEADENAIKKMQAIFGYKKSDKPIIIQDVVNIFLIGK